MANSKWEIDGGKLVDDGTWTIEIEPPMAARQGIDGITLTVGATTTTWSVRRYDTPQGSYATWAEAEGAFVAASKPTIVDDGSPEVRSRVEAVLDEHWDAVEQEIERREIDRGGDLLDTDRDLLAYITKRRARRAAEIGGAS